MGLIDDAAPDEEHRADGGDDGGHEENVDLAHARGADHEDAGHEEGGGPHGDGRAEARAACVAEEDAGDAEGGEDAQRSGEGGGEAKISDADLTAAEKGVACFGDGDDDPVKERRLVEVDLAEDGGRDELASALHLARDEGAGAFLPVAESAGGWIDGVEESARDEQRRGEEPEAAPAWFRHRRAVPRTRTSCR